jgi:hypothetical protein
MVTKERSSLTGNTQDTVCWRVADMPGKEGLWRKEGQDLESPWVRAAMPAHPSRGQTHYPAVPRHDGAGVPQTLPRWCGQA